VDIICIGEWCGIISFYNLNGKIVGRERNLNFIPLKICYFPNNQYIVISGSNKQCILLSHDGIQLVTLGSSFSSWTWCCAIHPESTHFVC
jgi:intraflagellar transport protein 122